MLQETQKAAVLTRRIPLAKIHNILYLGCSSRNTQIQLFESFNNCNKFI